MKLLIGFDLRRAGFLEITTREGAGKWKLSLRVFLMGQQVGLKSRTIVCFKAAPKFSALEPSFSRVECHFVNGYSFCRWRTVITGFTLEHLLRLLPMCSLVIFRSDIS